MTGMPSTFIITCGAGATLGFASWSEAVAAGQDGQFGDETLFNELRSRENLLWFRVEWSPQVNAGTYHMYKRDGHTINRSGSRDFWHYMVYNIPAFPRSPATSTSEQFDYPGTGSKITAFQFARKSQLNFGGTIRWIQRLDRAPPTW